MSYLSPYHWVVLVSAGAVTVAQVGVVVTFAVCCCRTASGSWRLVCWFRVAVWLTMRSGAQVLNETLKPTPEQHQAFIENETKLTGTTLVVGAIGLAAWSQLFVSSRTGPASQLSGMTLGLLFAGSAVLLTGPLVWRGAGLYLTELGRNLTFEVGYSFIGFALATTVADLRLWVLATLAAAVSALIAARAARPPGYRKDVVEVEPVCADLDG